MSSLVNVAEKEVMRNEILKIFQEAAPQGASIQVLRAGLKKMGLATTEDEVEKQVSYLEGKQLLQVERVGNERLGIRRTVAFITSTGIDVLEGNDTSVGIADS